MQDFKTFLNEASLSRVLSHTQGRNIGMITAHRGENTTKENKARNEELQNSIRAAGFGFMKVKGRYVEGYGTPNARNVDEQSFLVIGKKGNDEGNLLGFLKRHGEKYGQDSVLHKAYDAEHAFLHGTKEGGFPGKDESHNVGTFHPNRAGEFHTAMKGDRTFAFVESIQFLSPISFFSRTELEF